MAEIKTSFRNKLSNILGLVSPLKYTGLIMPPKLIPTIDYHKTMQEYPLIEVNLAGNDTYYIKSPKGIRTCIYYGRLKYTADANASDRIPILQIRDKSDNNSFAWWQIKQADKITANQTKWIYLSNINYDYDSYDAIIDPIYAQFVTPHWLHEEDQYKLHISGGLAGDSIELRLRLIQEPIPEGWNQ